MSLSVRVDQKAGPSAVGTQAVTDPGFTPKLLLTWNGLQTANGPSSDAQWSLGAASSTTTENAAGYNSNDVSATSAPVRFYNNSRLLVNFTGGSVTSNIVADLSSFDASGFTMNWATLVTANPLFNYLALGGSDITNVATGNFAFGTGTGNASVSTLGFQPDIVFFFGTLQASSGQSANNSNYGFGVATSSAQWAMAQRSQSAQATMNTTRAFDATSCFILPSSVSDTVVHQAQLVSLDAGGFTVNVSAASGVASLCGYIAVKGGNWKVGTDTQKTSTGTKATTGVGFTPAAVMFGSVGDTQTTGTATNARLMFGASDGSRHSCLWTGDQDAAADSVANTIMSNTSALVMATEGASATPTTNAEASVASLDTDGFTLNWTTADATARLFGYVAVGGTAVTPAASNGNLLTLGVG